MKKVKALRTAHTADTQYGMGDYYGTGIKAKVGRMRDDYMNMHETNPKKLKTPPRATA